MDTQEQQIRQHLLIYGSIRRNWCLNKFITRLGARIIDLKKKGWKFEDGRHIKTDKGKDFIYELVSSPQEPQEPSHGVKPIIPTQSTLLDIKTAYVYE